MLVLGGYLLLVAVTDGVPDNWGKEFILAFAQFGPPSQKTIIRTEITGMPNVRVNLNYMDKQRSINLAKNGKTELFPNIASYGRFGKMEQKGISISTTSTISVHGVSERSDISNGFICIPVDRLSTSYVVVTYLPDPKCQTFFTIVSKHDNTKVTITLRLAKKYINCYGLHDGSKKVITMTKLSVFGIKCSSDLTGSTIRSNTVIAVMVGSMCQTRFNANLVENMMLPKSLFGWNYVLPVYPVLKSRYRVYAPEAGTMLTSSTGKQWGNILMGRPLDLVLDVDKPLCVSSTQGMYVLAVLIPAEKRKRQCPTVNPVPSSSQYLQHYTINLAKKSQYYLTMIVHKDVVDLLAQAVGKLNHPTVFTHDIESCSMKTFTKVVDTSGLLNFNSTVPFGLIVYSMKADRASGLEPGMLMDLTNCPTDEGFIYFPADEICVKYEHREVTRQFASIYCHKAGGFLLDIKTDKMFQAIKDVYSKFGGTAFIGGFRYRYSETFNIWLWSDCDPVKNWTAKNSRTCMALQGKEMIWGGRNCNANSSSICGFDVQHVPASGTITKRKKIHGTRCRKLLPDIVAKLQTTTGTSMLTSKETTHHDTVTGTSHHTGTVSSTGITSASTARETETTHTSTLKLATSITPSDTTTDTLMWTTETRTNNVSVSNKVSTQRKTTNVPSTPTTERILKTTQIRLDDSPKPVTSTVQHDVHHRTSGQPTALDTTVLMKEFLKSSSYSPTVLREKEKILCMLKKRSWTCNCFCRSNRLQNMSKEAMQEHRAMVKKELGVAKSSLRKTLSKKTCATDNRPSANAVGCFGFMFLIFPVAVIILSDINTLLINHSTNSRKKKQAGCYINLSTNSLSSSSSSS